MSWEDIDSRQEDVEAAPVLPEAASSCSLKKQAATPQVKPTKIKWALIQQKDPNLMQVQLYLSWRYKPSSRECQRLSNTVRHRLQTWGNVLYCQARIPTEQWDILQIVVPQLYILQTCQVLHATSGHFRVDWTEALVRRNFPCSGLAEKIQRACWECASCSMHKTPPIKTSPMAFATLEPFELITIDFLMIFSSLSGYCPCL